MLFGPQDFVGLRHCTTEEILVMLGGKCKSCSQSRDGKDKICVSKAINPRNKRSHVKILKEINNYGLNQCDIKGPNTLFIFLSPRLHFLLQPSRINQAQISYTVIPEVQGKSSTKASPIGPHGCQSLILYRMINKAKVCLLNTIEYYVF